MDLKSAYKQLPLSPLDFDKSIVSLWSVEDRAVKCFECHVLPFWGVGECAQFLARQRFLASCWLPAWYHLDELLR